MRKSLIDLLTDLALACIPLILESLKEVITNKLNHGKQEKEQNVSLDN